MEILKSIQQSRITQKNPQKSKFTQKSTHNIYFTQKVNSIKKRFFFRIFFFLS